MSVGNFRLSADKRFHKNFIPVTNSGCWLWIGSLSVSNNKYSSGYGSFMVNGKTVRAHRYSYEQKFGLIPKGLELDHKCRVLCCVNPDHVEPVTHQENVRRGNSGKHFRDKMHCPGGPPYSGSNLYNRPDGGRDCKVCQRRRNREYILRNLKNKETS